MLRFSIEINPFQWAWKPLFNAGKGDKFEPNMCFLTARWLFLTILVYIDNGTIIQPIEEEK